LEAGSGGGFFHPGGISTDQAIKTTRKLGNPEKKGDQRRPEGKGQAPGSTTTSGGLLFLIVWGGGAAGKGPEIKEKEVANQTGR